MRKKKLQKYVQLIIKKNLKTVKVNLKESCKIT